MKIHEPLDVVKRIPHFKMSGQLLCTNGNWNTVICNFSIFDNVQEIKLNTGYQHKYFLCWDDDDGVTIMRVEK